jgi:iron complex outermembrane receptor protein
LSDMPLARSLTVDGAYRHANYSHAGSVDAWKVGLFWEPVSDIRFRGTLGTAVRAPNIVEAFRPDETSSAGVQDACSQENVNLNPNRLANCTALGRPVGWVNPLGGRTLPLRVSGNPDLDVESSDSWTVGLTFAPRFLTGLVLSLDWYDIEIEDAIVVVGAGQTVSNCVDNPGAPDPRFCTFVARDMDPSSPFFFALTSIRSTYVNASKLTTSGLDLTVDYGFELAGGTLDFRLVGSYLNELRQFPFQTNPGVFIDDVGFTNAPEYAGFLTTTYSWDAWQFSWQVRGQSSADTTASLGRRPIVQDINETGSIFYHDVALRYDFSKRGTSDAQAYIGVQNLFDESIPTLRVQEWFTSGGAYETNGPTVYAGFSWRTQ